MVRKKTLRAPAKPKTVEDETAEPRDDRDSINTLQKRLDDFDQQVQDCLIKMEADKQATLNAIRNLFFIDQQRTPANINNMLLSEYISQTTTKEDNFVIRKSVDTLIESVEGLTKTVPKKRAPKQKIIPEAPPGTVRRSARNRNTNTSVLGNSQVQNTPYVPMSTKTRGRKGKEMVTPRNENIPPRNMLITPKFDMRAPIPPSTLRKARPGELMVSLRGSPINNPKTEEIQEIFRSMPADADKETMQIIKEKFTKLMELN